jgi:hypothetical protein
VTVRPEDRHVREQRVWLPLIVRSANPARRSTVPDRLSRSPSAVSTATANPPRAGVPGRRSLPTTACIHRRPLRCPSHRLLIHHRLLIDTGPSFTPKPLPTSSAVTTDPSDLFRVPNSLRLLLGSRDGRRTPPLPRSGCRIGRCPTGSGGLGARTASCRCSCQPLGSPGCPAGWRNSPPTSPSLPGLPPNAFQPRSR